MTQILDLSDRSDMFYWQTNRKISADDMKRVFLDRHNTVSIEDTRAAIEYGMVQAGKLATDARVVSMGEPIPRGSVNNVLKAVLADGTEIAVRMHPYYVQNGYFWAESVATQLAKDSGIPCFSTYFIDDSKSKFSFDYMIMEALPGKTLQDFWPLDDETDKKITKQTGMYAAMIHAIKVDKFGFFYNTVAKEQHRLVGQYSTFKEHFFAGIREDFDFLVSHAVLSHDQASHIESVLHAHDDLLSITDGCLIHNDIADWNELSDGQRITGMIDWDECFGGDPVMDFAQWSLFFDDKRFAYFKEGYAQFSKLPECFEEKINFFKLRYVLCKLHLRKKRALVLTDSTFMNQMIDRGMVVLAEELKYFGINL